MKKVLLSFLTIMVFSCGNDDTSQTDAIAGKWIIYRTEYENTTYEHQINGQCGKETLVMSADSFVTETFYTNDDCTTYTATTEWEWRAEGNGIYNIYQMGQTVPERNVIMTGNEIKVTEPGFITVNKYYKRAL